MSEALFDALRMWLAKRRLKRVYSKPQSEWAIEPMDDFREQFARVNRYLPQLKDAIGRYEGDENWGTVAALCTACEAMAGADWAMKTMDNEPAWNLDSEIFIRARDL